MGAGAIDWHAESRLAYQVQRDSCSLAEPTDHNAICSWRLSGDVRWSTERASESVRFVFADTCTHQFHL